MSDSQTWDVPCYVCGFKLGTNKAKCGQAEGGKRAVKYPPCAWAHTDEKYVRTAFARAAEAEEQKKKQEEEIAEAKARYERGEMDFEEDDTQADQNQVRTHEFINLSGGGADASEAPASGGGDVGGQAGVAKGGIGGDAGTQSQKSKGGKPGKQTTKAAQEQSEDKDGGTTGKHTKWTSTTRTMLYKCIQNKDPFHTAHKEKAKVWDDIAAAMRESTKLMVNTAEGDTRCHAQNGKTLTVFYTREKKHYLDKDRDEDDKHSGTAGGADDEDDSPDAKKRKEERKELHACIELEKSADEFVQAKRDANKSLELMKNGVVNDFIVACAAKDPKVKPFLVKELSSRLRAAKMRKMLFEKTNKDGVYTYTAEDMENFRLWDEVRETDPQLPEAEDIDGDIPASKKGGQLVAALQSLTAQGAQLRQHFTPMSPGEFASEFFKAKRSHAEATKVTLKQQLQMVDDDVAEKTITKEEGESFKKKIKDEHYASIASIASP